ncbi:MAG: glycosyltransferase [Aeromicrobium sp.]|nr:glycosyltransferase [Burkholderiales bacterium]
MKVAITADPELAIPPKFYGGIERVIDMLVRGLVARGHEVTLFAHAESDVPCKLVPYSGTRSGSAADTLRNMMTISRTVIGGGFDVVHSFGRIAYLLPLLPLSIPKLMTYQREITPASIGWGHRLSRGTLHFSAISNWMIADVKHLASWHLVYNGVPMQVYDFVQNVEDDAPLVFLGRIEHIKGTHLAIEIAQRTGRRLVIAGNIPPAQQSYFDTRVKPHLHSKRITYIGAVDDQQKNILLGSAAALLMPILWEEPFGIVMAEALACGTPVLALRRGAVPEVIVDGVTGFVRDDVDGLVQAVADVARLDRRGSRARAESIFSDSAVVDAYLNVYDLIRRYTPRGPHV